MRRDRKSRWEVAKTFKEIDKLVHEDINYGEESLKESLKIMINRKFTLEEIHSLYIKYTQDIVAYFPLQFKDNSINTFNTFCQKLDDVVDSKMIVSLFCKRIGKNKTFKNNYHFIEAVENAYTENIKMLNYIEYKVDNNAKIIKLEVYKFCVWNEQLKKDLKPKIFKFIEKEAKRYKEEVKKRLKKMVIQRDELKEQLEQIYEKLLKGEEIDMENNTGIGASLFKGIQELQSNPVTENTATNYVENVLASSIIPQEVALNKETTDDVNPETTSKEFNGELQVNNIIPYTILNIEDVDDVNSKLEIINKILCQTGKYQILNNRLVFNQKGVTPISNFIVAPELKIEYTDDQDRIIKYVLEAICLDNPEIKLPKIEVSLNEFSTFKFIIGSEWEKYCIVEYGNSNYSRLREVAQIIARYTMKEKKIYTNTGFKDIDDKKVYLYNGGSIGEVENVTADLSQDKLEDYSFTEKEYDKQEALETSYSVLELAPPEIMIPLSATLYLSPIQTMLEKEEIFTDYVLFVVGETGVRKSSICAIILNHFGPRFNKDNLTASFKDTSNNLEKKAWTLKDTIIVVDDFNPSIVGNRKLETLEQIFGIFGDRQGRGRMKPNGKSLTRAYKARSMAIINGELVPTDLPESRLARSIIINVEKDSVNLDVLTNLQENKEKLSFGMMKYIEWVIKNESGIMEYAKSKMKDLRAIQDNEIHGRTNDSINIMTIGFNLFLEFLKDNQIIDNNKQIELNALAEDVLRDTANQQVNEIENANPITMFYNAIEELINIDKISLLDYSTGELQQKYSKGKIVGYIDKQKGQYYFYPNTIYKEICNFYSYLEGGYPLSKGALLKGLDQANLLCKNEVSRKTVLRTDAKTHEKVRVMAVKILKADDEQFDEE